MAAWRWEEGLWGWGGRGKALGIYRGGGVGAWGHSGLGPLNKISLGLKFR